MKKYDSYKDSGIEWLGEIPEHWEVKRLKNIFSLGTGLSITKKNLLDVGVPCVSYGEIHSKYGFEVNPQVHLLKCVEEEYLITSKRSLLKKGDFIFADTSEDIEGSGNFAYLNSDIQVFAGYHTIVAKPKLKLNSRFIAYLFDSVDYRSQVRSNVAGIKVYSITQGLLKKLNLYFPPNQEQTAIVHYLDTKTQAIDQKVQLLERKIGYYKELRQSIINEAVTKGLDRNVKLKDSGINWIGQIPEHWEVKRFKDSFDIFTGNSISDKSKYENPDDAIPYIATKDIDLDTGKLDFNNGIYILKSDKSFKMTKSNTSLICIEGANAGKKIGFTNIPISFVNKVCAFKGKAGVNIDKYNFYYLNSIGFSDQFFSLMSGLIGGVSINKIKNLFVLIPPLKEQTAIAQYLDQKTQTIDRITANIQKQIATLKELRKTLINEVVTGKQRVYEPIENTVV